MVRALTDIVMEEDIVESDYMTTQLVVISKGVTKDFLNCYQKLADYVVRATRPCPALSPSSLPSL